MAAMTFWAAVLLTYGVSTGIAMVPGGSSKNPGRYVKASSGSSKIPSRYLKASRASSPVASGSSNVPSTSWQVPSGAGAVAGANNNLELDMAPNSVDDMYDGCKDKMKTKVQTEYLQNEKNGDRNFKEAWDEAERYDTQKWKRKKGKRPPTYLGKEQAVAIYAYTLDKPNIYSDFNNAVRTQRDEYKTTFSYHTLHFFLTDALQTLNARKPEAEICLTGYRRVNSYFSQDVLNKVIRFGSFTSSSMGCYPSAERFGDKSCFEIITCLGADVSLYSKLGESEREVLIPPYEVFKVTNIERRSDQKSLPCEVVYKVKSTHTPLSNLNCALF